jgi:hypothetical protein
VLKPATASPAQTSGAFELRKDGRQTQQSMRTAEPRRSVVIDTELVNVVAAASATPPNAATSRPTNMPTMQDSPGSRVTGEMKAVPSGRSRAQAKIGSVSSFQIDPSLAVAIDAQTKPDPPRQDLPSPETKHGVHRPSGGFSPVESDFFEREAELYKFEQSESFADLDDGKAHRGGSGKPSTGPSKPK